MPDRKGQVKLLYTGRSLPQVISTEMDKHFPDLVFL